MNKKILIAILIVIAVVSVCFILVACDIKCNCENCGGTGTNINNPSDDRMVHITFNYTLTTQFMSGAKYPIVSILYKPENPTFKDHVFNAGYDKVSDGFVSEFDLPIDYPRMEEGYDVNKDYCFVGWYTEPEYRYQWNFAEDRIYRDMTLYAKWMEI